jgi:antitoxin HicB
MTEAKKEMQLPETKDLSYYLSLNYPMEIVEDDGRFVVSIPDLPGCVSYADTPEEALANLKATKQLWLKGALESGQTIIEPSVVEDFSGKFVLRIPRSLHHALDREARKQGVSLNMYVAHLLSERHKLTWVENVAEQWAAACAASSKTTVQCKHVDFSQWKSEGSADFWQLDLIGASGSRGNVCAEDAPLINMVDYLPKPPKVYRAVVKQNKGVYQNV